MKPASTALINFLNQVRANPDSPIAFADLYDFTFPQTGITISYTSTDQDVVYNGTTYSAQGPLVSGLKMKQSVGLEVDKQQITLAARPTDLINGAMFLAAVGDGAFDGATVVRTRAFMSALGQVPVGGVVLFKGRVSTVDMVGRTEAKITVASDLIALDMDMPKNLYSQTCLHVLYDSGCTLNAASFATSGTVGAGSTVSLINFSGAIQFHAQGKIIFTSGVNADLTATVNSAVAGTSLSLRYPLPEQPGIGDAFTVYQGCDHSKATCNSVFNNLINFRGFPYIPPPQTAF